MTKVIVHRGTRAIGGSCIEIAAGRDRLILDLGMPLMARDGAVLDETAIGSPSVENGVLPDVQGLYDYQSPSITAVVLSHPHLDHYGLMDWVHPQIPIYLSRESKTLIEVGNVFYQQRHRQEGLLEHCHTFEHWKPFPIGPFALTSHLTDHSAFGASSLLMEVDGKRIFYTGHERGGYSEYRIGD